MRPINVEIVSGIINDLQNGILNPLLRVLQNDGTLDLEIRTDYISIYYRGGSIAKIMPRSEHQGGYRVEISEMYFNHNNVPYNVFSDSITPFLNINSCDETIEFIKELPYRKTVMDAYLSIHRNLERQYQQWITYENNNDLQSNFYICDTEIVDNNITRRARYDMTMVKRADGDVFTSLEFFIVELKYKTQAINGAAGIYNHFLDLNGILEDDFIILKNNALIQLEYKKDLGLCKFNKYVNQGLAFDENNNSINLIFYFASLSIRHHNLFLPELENIINYQQEHRTRVNVFIYIPFAAGNLMYTEELIPLTEDFINKIRDN